MPSLNKKTFVYSSDRARKVCEGLLKDRSTTAKVTESVLIENSILNTLLPQNEDAAMWVELLYDGETLADAYARLFCHFASGTMYQATHANGQLLVEKFCRLVSLSIYRFSGKEKEFPHMLQQLTYLLEIMPENDPWHDRELLVHYIQQLKNDPADISAQDIANLIYRNFSVIGNSTRTYRALMDIACIAGPTLRDTPALRIVFIDTLIEVSSKW